MKQLLSTGIIVLAMLFAITDASAQSCVQPASNMVSWWPGDGNALDVRGLINGTPNGGTAFAAGYKGQAFSLDGLNDTIGFGNPSSLQVTSVTIEAWIKKSGMPLNGIENVFAKWGFDASVDSYLFGVVDAGGTLRAIGAIGDGTSGDPGLSGGQIALDTWTHLAMTYDAADGMHKLYVNGTEVAARIRPNGIFTTNSNAYIGNEDSPVSRFFKGLIDEPALYGRALSAAEIQAIYNAGSAGKCGGSGQSDRNLVQRQKLQPNSPAGSRGFGNAVAIDGNTMVVGASGYDTTLSTEINRGAAYVFVRSGGTWTQQAQLLAGDGAAGDEFGNAVAIKGDTIVVGSFRSNAAASNSGAAYVFTRSGTVWTQQQKLTANDGAADDEFGNSVALGIDTVAIGAHLADQPNGGGSAGAVYVFNRSGTSWTQAQKLVPTGTILFGDFHGESVATSGDTLVVGASGDDDWASDAGSFYIYTRNGPFWGLSQKLVRLDGTAGDSLGAAVAIDGNTIAIAAPGDTPIVGQPNRGSVFVYVSNGGGFTPQQQLTASDAAASDYFGWSLAVRGNRLAVGARFDDTTAGADAGSTYIFRRSGAVWSEQQKLAPADAAAGDRFGASASLDADGTLVVGAADKNLPAGQGNGAGAVYVFNSPPKTSPYDFDGDGKTDVGIYRPWDGSWWYIRSLDDNFRVFNFGNSTDIMTPGDFTGDGKADIAIWRPSNSTWYILRSEDGSFFSFPFGATGDIPVAADFDGDGKTDAAVFRPSSGNWYVLNSNGSGISTVGFGANGDHPAAADYDGDGKTDIAIFRPSDGSWWYLQSSDLNFKVYRFGESTDKPVPGDWTGDGKADLAVFRTSTGHWYFQRSEDNSYYSLPFGAAGDVAAPGDYDGDGKFDTAVFRPATGNWFVQRSTAGLLITAFGANGDRPIANAFVP